MKVLIITLLLLFVGCGAVPLTLSPEEKHKREERVVELIARATVLMRRGDSQSFESALAALELAREFMPADARVFDAIGCVEWRRGNLELAEEYFKKALEQDTTYDRAYAHLATVAEQRGDKEAAEELLQMAIEINPLNYRARTNLAALRLEGGLLSESERQETREQLLKALHVKSGEEAVVLYNMQRTQ